MSISRQGKAWYSDFVHKGQRYTGSVGPVSRMVAKEGLTRKRAEVGEGRLNSQGPDETNKTGSVGFVGCSSLREEKFSYGGQSQTA
jgi:hypothetical protein